MLIDVRPRIVQPRSSGVSIDWSHPLAHGLVFASVCTDGGAPRDLVRHGRSSQQGSPPPFIAASSRGVAATQSTSGWFQYNNYTPPSTTTPWTMAARVIPTGTLSTNCVAIIGAAGNNSPHLFAVLGGWRAGIWSDGNADGGTATVGVAADIVGTFDLTNLRLYQDGSLVGGPTAGTPGAITGNYINILSAAGSWPLDGQMPHIYVWHRALSAGEVMALYAEPYAFLRPLRPLRAWKATGGGAQTVAVGQAVETDLAQPITVMKARGIGQAIEADLAQAISRGGKVVAVGQVSEADLAQPLTKAKRQILGQASEIDVAQSVSLPGVTIVPVAQVSETDLAQPIVWAPKRRIVNQASEADLAQPLTARKMKALGIALETDLAQVLSRSKRRVVGQALETDLAQALTWAPKRRMVGQVLEVDLAQPVTMQIGERLLNIVAVTLHVQLECNHVLEVVTECGVRLAVVPAIERAGVI